MNNIDYNDLRHRAELKLITESKTSFSEKLVLYLLKCNEPLIEISNKDLACLMNMSIRNVQKILSNMRKKRLIQEEQRIGKTAIKFINYEQLKKTIKT